MKNQKTITLFIVSILLFFSFSEKSFAIELKKQPELTTLILVRHAEKNNETDTTTLTADGYNRAERLSRMLINTNLAAIYATPYVRMHLTAKPTAVQKNLAIQDYTPHDISIIENIVATHYGKTILMIGHNNNIPQIINHYCGTNLSNLQDYHDIFVLNIFYPGAKKNSFLRFYY